MEIKSINLINALEDLMATSKTVPFTDKLMIERKNLTDIIEALKESLPPEVQGADKYFKDNKKLFEQAEQEIKEQLASARESAEEIVGKAKGDANNIISEANDEAKNIVQEAEEQRLQLINNNEIMLAANEKATQIVNEANQTSRNVKMQTKEYLDTELKKVTQVLARVYNEIETNRKDIN